MAVAVAVTGVGHAVVVIVQAIGALAAAKAQLVAGAAAAVGVFAVCIAVGVVVEAVGAGVDLIAGEAGDTVSVVGVCRPVAVVIGAVVAQSLAQPHLFFAADTVGISGVGPAVFVVVAAVLAAGDGGGEQAELQVPQGHLAGDKAEVFNRRRSGDLGVAAGGDGPDGEGPFVFSGLQLEDGQPGVGVEGHRQEQLGLGVGRIPVDQGEAVAQVADRQGLTLGRKRIAGIDHQGDGVGGVAQGLGVSFEGEAQAGAGRFAAAAQRQEEEEGGREGLHGRLTTTSPLGTGMVSVCLAINTPPAARPTPPAPTAVQKVQR